MSSSFTKKRIDVVFGIAQDGFGGATQETLRGHRVSCQILSAGQESGIMCNLRIEGMGLDLMNRLSTVQAGVIMQSMNTVSVYAGAAQTERPVVFSGGIIEGFVDYSGAPDVAFEVRALSTSIPAAVPIAPTSFKGAVTVATVMETIAKKAGLAFNNNGVTAILAGGVTYNGTATEQIGLCAAATRTVYMIGMNTLFIWPSDFTADASGAIDVSAATGMIGYPAYSQYGVDVQTLFNPAIGFRSTLKLNSAYSPAAWVNKYGQLRSATGGTIYPPSNGLWVVQRLQHDLQSEVPDGPWVTTLTAARPEFAGMVTYAN
ncbi:hypothetical protein K2X14_11635 [Acetobacter sp. TBRC 12305]|uniref:Uncharacterized protein n=1 Tax=Acetobacter garciniae TaxID=2817435 RepID=A0A939HP49_9PROT|nr:hypothetical protein [Acetobacter garciniae]MBO1325338.1 hypothetical protein [Acetobacter garciniae]MBX0345490.1 hypothetical protein [Acetobacter garciniae]